MKWVFIRAFEVWAVGKLLNSPAFHRGVHKVHNKVHHLRTGIPIEQGGTQVERSGPGIFQHFRDEIKEQLGMTRQKPVQKQIKSPTRSTDTKEWTETGGFR